MGRKYITQFNFKELLSMCFSILFNFILHLIGIYKMNYTVHQNMSSRSLFLKPNILGTTFNSSQIFAYFAYAKVGLSKIGVISTPYLRMKSIFVVTQTCNFKKTMKTNKKTKQMTQNNVQSCLEIRSQSWNTRRGKTSEFYSRSKR